MVAPTASILAGAPPALAALDPGISARLGVDAVITTRHGGVSTGPYRSSNLALHVGDRSDTVLENRRRALTRFGASLDHLVLAAQVHGNHTAVVSAADSGRGARTVSDAVAGADALVTTEPQLVLGVLVADCVPVLLAHRQPHLVACVHAGWRGAATGVLESALGVMTSLGARPAAVTALLGPAVHPDHYQVDRPVAEAICGVLGPDTGCLVPDGDDHWRLDLPGAARQLLAGAGVDPKNIHTSPLTTKDRSLYSHRGSGGKPCGRFGLLARLRP